MPGPIKTPIRRSYAYSCFKNVLFFMAEHSESAKNVFFTHKYFRAFALVLRNSVESAIVVFVFPRDSCSCPSVIAPVDHYPMY